MNTLGLRSVVTIAPSALTAFVELFVADGAKEGFLSVRPEPNQTINNVLIENNSIPAEVVQPGTGKPYYRFELVRGGKYRVEPTSLFTLWDASFTVPDKATVLLSDLIKGIEANQ